MKKSVLILLAFLLTLSCALPGAAAEEKLQVVVTIFPLYDWVREIAGDRAEVTMLLDTGVDLHSYQPTVRDMMTVSEADLFLYVGGESDEWVEDVLSAAASPDLIALNLLEMLGEDVKNEETVEGMEEDEEEEEEAADEHVWLSLKNAWKLAGLIADQLSEMDPEGAADYAGRAEAYRAALLDLDRRYQEAVDAAAYHTLLFGDRFPFRYLADDYGLTYYAAFSGCHAEAEASFQTIAFLAEKVDELDLPVVLTIENPQTRIAKTIVESTAKGDQKILSMDSMQSVVGADIQNGVTYLSVMEENLKVLSEALNGTDEY